MSTRTTTSGSVIERTRRAGARGLRHVATWVAIAVAALMVAATAAVLVNRTTSAGNAANTAPAQQAAPVQERTADPGQRLVEINGGAEPVDSQAGGARPGRRS